MISRGWFHVAAVILCVCISPPARAYVGVGVGGIDTTDGGHLGYGITFGVEYPQNTGVEFQIFGYLEQGNVDHYWLQMSADGFYDFHEFWNKLTDKVELHPYAKLGFTYGIAIANAYRTTTAYGPGFNVGAGVDWKVLPFLSVGLDLSEHILFLHGKTLAGLGTTADQDAYLFNVMFMVKLFSYRDRSSDS